MVPTLHIHRLADKEISKAIRWYGKRSIGLAERLRASIRDGLKQVIEAPQVWPPQPDGARLYQLKVFPYLIVYYWFFALSSG